MNAAEKALRSGRRDRRGEGVNRACPNRSREGAGEPLIRLEDVHKWFGNLHVLKGWT